MMMKVLRCGALGVFVALVTAGHATDNLMLDPRLAPARARVEALQRKLDDYRDHPAENDFRTIWVDMPGGAQPRRIPTEEFQARIERTQAELTDAEQEVKRLERSLD
ncbi:MAG TPA: hypothetical protein VH040_17750 [Usitatibacter sp.]|nr:hypothetical protein [Usitatibacter sp.]